MPPMNAGRSVTSGSPVQGTGGPATLFNETEVRLQTILEGVEAATGRVGSLADRIIGIEPAPSGTASAPQPPHPHAAGRLMALLNLIQAAIELHHAHINRIEKIG